MNCGIPPPAKCLVKRETRVVEPSPAEKFEGTVGQSGPCHRGDPIDYRSVSIFGMVHFTDLRNRSFHRLCGNEGASRDLIQPRMEASQQNGRRCLATLLSLVARLLAEQFPQWADSPIEPVHSAGTDKAIYRLGDDMAVRLPRIHWATGQVDK
jgi:hypothetical protein